jgi:hypothetical protein
MLRLLGSVSTIRCTKCSVQYERESSNMDDHRQLHSMRTVGCHEKALLSVPVRDFKGEHSQSLAVRRVSESEGLFLKRELKTARAVWIVPHYFLCLLLGKSDHPPLLLLSVTQPNMTLAICQTCMSALSLIF